MKKLFVFIISIIIPSLHAQNLEWAINIGSWQSDYSRSIAVDNAGNIYTTGSFEDTTDFDPGPGITQLIPNGLADIFIQKTDGNGNLIWAKNIGGIEYDHGRAIVVDENGFIYISGEFTNTVDFDPGPGTVNQTAASTSSDIFTLKLDTAGNFVWVSAIGSTLTDEPYSVAIDASGNVITVGIFGGFIDFDPGAGSFTLDPGSGSDLFIQKLDNNGNFVWAVGLGNTSSCWPTDVVIDPSGNIHTTGIFQGTLLDFDPGPGTFNLSSNGVEDIFILKLDAGGNFLWVKQMGGINYDDPNSITLDESGNVYTVGYFNGTVDFDPGPAVQNLISSGVEDGFLQKLDSLGNLTWVKKIGGSLSQNIKSVEVDSSDYVYISGNYNGTTDFDPGIGIYNMPNIGNDDIFIEKLTASGNLVWCKQIAGYQSEYTGDIAIKNNGVVYITGIFSDSTDFDPDTGSCWLSSNGSSDIFLAKLTPDLCSNVALVIDSVHPFSCITLNGSAITHVEGGLPPYTYSWNTVPPINDSIAIFTDGRFYTLLISDANGCNRSTTILINAPQYLTGFDLNSNLVSDPFRPGFETYVFVNAFNDGCDTSSATLTVILDSLTSLISSSPIPDLISGDTLTWNIAPLNFDSLHFMPVLHLNTDINAVIGDSVSIIVNITPVSGDQDTLNNFKIYRYPIVNGYDPNDKNVYPLGQCHARYVQVNEKLTYTIRFQNTGNSEAINIYLLDSLSSHLDSSTIRVIGYSHPVLTQLLQGNVLKFSFNNIHLPDSGTNELLSHGYVIFEVMADSNVTSGSEVYNTAKIFFDFNPAIVTNTVLNTMVDVVPFCYVGIPEMDEQKFTLYPNPAENLIMIDSYEELQHASVEIMDLQGKIHLQQKHLNGYHQEIDISLLNPGLYFVTLYLDTQTKNFKIIKN